MISIIICSRKQKLPAKLYQNIGETVGFDYEIVIVDNSDNKYSIFEAYNLGIARSKGDYWCFVHDDVIFHTQKWGEEINRIFNSDKNVGLIGIAGTKIKTKMPSAWFDCPEEYKVINLIQHREAGVVVNRNCGFMNKTEEEVAVIDGVFMVGRKDKNIKFDENLTGFHNYDLNISIAYRNLQYKVMVTKSILLEHLSNGKIDKSWYLSTLYFDKLYSKYLPLQLEHNIFNIQKSNLEIYNGIAFCNGLKKFGLKKKIRKYWMKLCLINSLLILNKQFLAILFK